MDAGTVRGWTERFDWHMSCILRKTEAIIELNKRDCCCSDWEG